MALGVNLEGKKELLGLWLAETEGAKFWLSCLTDLQSRGLSDIFVACISLAHSSCWWRSDSAFPSN